MQHYVILRRFDDVITVIKELTNHQILVDVDDVILN
jgi:hypothetical protein